MEEGFKHWVGVKLTSPTIEGTVSAGTGLTMPAFTAGGDITLGANKIKTTNHLFKQEDATWLALRDIADANYTNIKVYNLGVYYALEAKVNGIALYAITADNGFFKMMAQDNGVGTVEVARLQGAADPYFQMTLPFVILPVATTALPVTPVNGMLAFDNTAQKLKVYTTAGGGKWETVSSA